MCRRHCGTCCISALLLRWLAGRLWLGVELELLLLGTLAYLYVHVFIFIFIRIRTRIVYVRVLRSVHMQVITTHTLNSNQICIAIVAIPRPIGQVPECICVYGSG